MLQTLTSALTAVPEIRASFFSALLLAIGIVLIDSIIKWAFPSKENKADSVAATGEVGQINDVQVVGTIPLSVEVEPAVRPDV